MWHMCRHWRLFLCRHRRCLSHLVTDESWRWSLLITLDTVVPRAFAGNGYSSSYSVPLGISMFFRRFDKPQPTP